MVIDESLVVCGDLRQLGYSRREATFFFCTGPRMPARRLCKILVIILSTPCLLKFNSGARNNSISRLWRRPSNRGNNSSAAPSHQQISNLITELSTAFPAKFWRGKLWKPESWKVVSPREISESYAWQPKIGYVPLLWAHWGGSMQLPSGQWDLMW